MEANMSKKARWTLLIIGILLLINGFGNIVDDAQIRCYDLASILTGVGFIVISKAKN
jgi:hypothetical protein